MLGRVVLARGIHTIACVRIEGKRYHATCYRVGGQDMVESLRFCDGNCPKTKGIPIPPNVAADIRKRVAEGRMYETRHIHKAE